MKSERRVALTTETLVYEIRVDLDMKFSII